MKNTLKRYNASIHPFDVFDRQIIHPLYYCLVRSQVSGPSPSLK